MPILETNQLIAAYVVIGCLLISLNLYSNWHWFVKAVATVFTVGFFAISYHSYSAILGWPTTREVPKQFYLHAVQIDEPERIYLWGTDLDRGIGQTAPRSYGLPYSSKLHDSANKAGRKLKKGLPVIGQLNNDETPAKVQGEQAHIIGEDLVFIDAPQALIPPK